MLTKRAIIKNQRRCSMAQFKLRKLQLIALISFLRKLDTMEKYWTLWTLTAEMIFVFQIARIPGFVGRCFGVGFG